MRYVKSVAVGIVTGVVFAVCWVLLHTVGPFVAQSRQIANSGSGGIGVVADFTNIAFLMPAVVGFLVGFVWTFRRKSRLAPTRR